MKRLQRPAAGSGDALVRYIIAATLARGADEGAPVALVLLAIARTPDPAAGAAMGGLLVAAMHVPHVIAGPLVGGLADRSRQPRLWFGGALLCYAAALAGAGLALGRTNPALPFLLVGAAGLAGPALAGGLSSLLPDLLEPGTDAQRRGRRVRGFALDATSYNIGGIAAPAAVAVTAGAFSATGAVLVLAGAAGVGGAVVARLPLPGRDRRSCSRSPLRFAAVARAFWHSRPLRATTVATTVSHAWLGGVVVAAPLLVTTLGRERAASGLLLAAFAAGALAGSLVMTRWRPRGRLTGTAVVHGSVLLTGVLLALAAAAPAFPVAVALFAAAGCCDGPLLTATLLVRAEHAPPPLRTQVFATAASLKIAAAAVGAALAGTAVGLGGAFDGRELLVFVAAGHAAAAVAGTLAGLPAGRTDARGR